MFSFSLFMSFSLFKTKDRPPLNTSKWRDNRSNQRGLSKPRRLLDVTTPKVKWFNHFFHKWQENPVARKFLQFSDNGLAPEVFHACLTQIWFATFDLRYPWSSESRGVSTSKERTGLNCGMMFSSTIGNILCIFSVGALSMNVWLCGRSKGKGTFIRATNAWQSNHRWVMYKYIFS